MTLTHLKRIFFISLLFIIILWAGAGFVFSITKNRQSKTTDLLSNIRLQSLRKDGIKSLANQVQTLDEKIKEIEGFFLGSGEESVVHFIEMLESVASRAKVDMNITSIETPKTKTETESNFEHLMITFETKGGFEETLEFMQQVETIPYALQIKKSLIKMGGLSSSDFENQDEENIEPLWQGVFTFDVLQKK